MCQCVVQFLWFLMGNKRLLVVELGLAHMNPIRGHSHDGTLKDYQIAALLVNLQRQT